MGCYGLESDMYEPCTSCDEVDGVNVDRVRLAVGAVDDALIRPHMVSIDCTRIEWCTVGKVVEKGCNRRFSSSPSARSA